MKIPVLILVIAIISFSFVPQGLCVTYDNSEIGLHVTYPASWQKLKNDDPNSPILLTLLKQKNMPHADLNPNIKVVAMQIPDDEWKDVSLNGTLNEQLDKVKSSIKGAKVITNAFPLPGLSDLHNFSVQYSIQSYTITQYQYVYWHPPFYVQVICSTSHENDLPEMKEVISSMKINKTNTPIGHEFHVPPKKPYITSVSNRITTSDPKNIASNLTIHWKYSDAYFLSKRDFIVDEANQSIKDIVQNVERNIVLNEALKNIISKPNSKTKAPYKDEIKFEIMKKVATELQHWDINVIKIDSLILVE